MKSNKEHAQKQRDNFASNLRRILRMRGKTQSDIVADLEITSSTVSDWANAKKYPRVDKMQTLADYLDVTVSDLREEYRPFPGNVNMIDVSKWHSIPVLGKVAAGLPIYAEENIEGYTLTDLNGGHEYFALRVRGDSMNAIGINDGYLIIIRVQEEVDNGDVAVVLVGDDEATVKRFYSTDTTVTLMPQSTNSKHQPQIYDIRETQIRILGKVVKVEFTL